MRFLAQEVEIDPTHGGDDEQVGIGLIVDRLEDVLGYPVVQHGGGRDHLPVLVDKQQEKTAGEEHENPAAKPVLLRARHVSRKRRHVGHLHRPPAERLQSHSNGNHHAQQRYHQMGDLGGHAQ